MPSKNAELDPKLLTAVRILIGVFIVCSPVSAQENHAALFQKYQTEGINLLQVKDYAGALQKFEAALKEHSSWQMFHSVAVCHSHLWEYSKVVTDEQKSMEAGGIHANQCITMAGALEGLGKPKSKL